jgi:myo-inositol-1-phosphate synthase
MFCLKKQMIRVAIVGVGNCASALIQGVAVAKANERILKGVTYENIGGYKSSDIDFVMAYDVDSRKVSLPLGEAIFSKPNCCYKIIQSKEEYSQLPISPVLMAPVLDGVAPHMLQVPENQGFRISSAIPKEKDEIIAKLKENKVDVLINYLPVGSQFATEWWAEICLEASVAFCNCIPVFIASDKKWEQKFILKGLPLIGDDMRSQFGASVLSQMLQELAFDRGHTVKAHIQQNFGGNTDFLNMTDKSRLASKKISKENVIRSQNTIRGISEDESFLYAGPSDYIQFYGDNKVASFHLELEGFGGAPVTFDARLSVQDSPNSAGVVIDAIRFLKVAREMKICGSLRGASAFTQKTPPQQLMFSLAKQECDALANRQFTSLTKCQYQSLDQSSD